MQLWRVTELIGTKQTLYKLNLTTPAGNTKKQYMCFVLSILLASQLVTFHQFVPSNQERNMRMMTCVTSVLVGVGVHGLLPHG
jgi:hypothetical protein